MTVTSDERIRLLKLVAMLKKEARKGAPAWFSPAELNEMAGLLESIAEGN